MTVMGTSTLTAMGGEDGSLDSSLLLLFMMVRTVGWRSL
jgi:hypothetical protein